MKLITLGELRLDGSTFTRPKALVLLAYLQLEGIQNRCDIAELFWPSSVDAMKAFRVFMTQINKEIERAIQADSQKIWVDLSGDVLELREALEKKRLVEAIALYKGPFLAGIDLSDIGEELEEWIYKTREYFADAIRQVLLSLGEQEASQGNYKEGADYAQKAYFLRSAPEPTQETLEQMYVLLKVGQSQYAEDIAKEAKNYNVDLHLTPEEAKAKLNKSLESIEVAGSDEQLSMPGQSETNSLDKVGETPVFLTARSFTRKAQRSYWLLGAGGLFFALVVVGYFFVSSFKTKEINLGPDDVDVALESYYFCNTHKFLYLSSKYDEQSTALRFRDVFIPKSTTKEKVIVKRATLTFMVSHSSESLTDEAGFTIKGLFDSSAWLVPEPNDCKLDPIEAKNYIERKRTIASETYHPTSWIAGEIHTIDVTEIVQELVDSSDWTSGAFAFAIDRAAESWIDLNVFSFDGATTNLDKRPRLSIDYTTQKMS
jgi:DNA-binding SARP family transcriptional activator